MDRRIAEFIAGLRAAGVRVSVAESADALRAIEQSGITDKEFFRMALQATLVKDQADLPTFQQLFPMYFLQKEAPPMKQPGGGQLSEDEQQKLQEMLEQMLANMTPQQLAQLFEAMMNGQRPSAQQMRAMLNGIPAPHMNGPQYQEWMARRAMRELQFNKLNQLLRELLEKLREAGVSEEALQQIEQDARENQQALAEQIGQQVGQQMMEQAGQGEGRQRNMNELLDKPFEYMTDDEAKDLRSLVNKLAARLRSRLALRQRRGKTGTLDAKGTIRANMQFGGVPMLVKHRRRHLKPKLVVLCDRSRSTEQVVSFMLLLIYTLQDQISRTRSFAYIDHLHDMSTYFAEHRPE
nr:VWA domain-containing protein [Chloroflexaceae bacterium]